jgi:hypothetical protein
MNQNIKIHDIVRIKGQGFELFTVEGYWMEHQHFLGQTVQEKLYTIKNVRNGIYKQVSPLEIEFVRSSEDDVKVHQIKQDIKGKVFDELLDKYNELLTLHAVFGDDEYLDRAQAIVMEMKKVD